MSDDLVRLDSIVEIQSCCERWTCLEILINFSMFRHADCIEKLFRALKLNNRLHIMRQFEFMTSECFVNYIFQYAL